MVQDQPAPKFFVQSGKGLTCIWGNLPQASQRAGRPACGWAWNGCRRVRPRSFRGTLRGSSKLTTKQIINLTQVFDKLAYHIVSMGKSDLKQNGHNKRYPFLAMTFIMLRFVLVF